MTVNRYAVGKITGCFGIKGYVKVYPTTHSPERMKDFRRIFIGKTADESKSVTVEDVVINRKGIFMKLSILNDRTAAESVVGHFLFIDKEHLSKPADGSYFVDDIIGCAVETSDGKKLGILEEVYKAPAQDLWAIRTNDTVVYIPAVKDFIKDVRIAERKIIIQEIEGLLEE